MSAPDKTPAERLQEALTACHDAAYTEAFKAGLDAIDRLATAIVGNRKMSRAQVAALRGAFLALAGQAKTAAELQLVQGRYEPALLSHECGADLGALAKRRFGEVVDRLGGGQ